jgi:hypothetical protein
MMEVNIAVSGETTKKMVMESVDGHMVTYLRVILPMICVMVKEYINLLPVTFTMENSNITGRMVMGLSLGLMVLNLQGNLKKE